MATRKSSRADNFEKAIIKIVTEKNMPYIDAILEYCEDNEVDPEYVKNLMTEDIKQKIEDEYESLNMFSKDPE